MRNFKITSAVFGLSFLLASAAVAQEAVTNTPPTVIENFELRTGTIIVKGFSNIGTLAVGEATVIVRSKESSDLGRGQKADGIAVAFSGGGSPQMNNFIPKLALMVDYDELDSLAGSIDYLGRISNDATPLNGFEASYATKSGLRIIAHSERKQGGVQTYIQFGDWPRMQLNPDQMMQLKNLITQAKASLDAIK